VHELRQQHPLDRLLKAARLSRSTFYYQKAALEAPCKYASIKNAIHTIFHEHRGRYGYRRITQALRNLGQCVNHKTVQRLMGELGLKSLVRPKKYKSYKGEVGRTAPNRLKRKFKAKRANQKWVTDVTEFKVADKKLFLSPVLDLHNGEIIAFETAEKPVFDMVESMLKKALAKLKRKERPMLHSDQGWQYQMPTYQRMLEERKMVQSMSRKGNCHDNAPMESFFAVLKSEFFHLNRFKSIDELKAGLTKYIHYYNHDRIKMKLGGMSPVQFRTRSTA
jgi:putative transposase